MGIRAVIETVRYHLDLDPKLASELAIEGYLDAVAAVNNHPDLDLTVERGVHEFRRIPHAEEFFATALVFRTYSGGDQLDGHTVVVTFLRYDGEEVARNTAIFDGQGVDVESHLYD